MTEFFEQLVIFLIVLDALVRSYFIWRSGRRLGLSSSSSSSNPTQFGNQTNQGAPNVQGTKNSVNTGTQTTTTANTKSSNSTSVNASNTIKADKGSTVNFITGQGSDTSAVLNSLKGIFQTPASTPVVVTPGSISTGSAASTGLNWNLIAIAGVVLASIFFLRKKS
jgi:hypothetical protein